jgi:hypothetical protein
MSWFPPECAGIVTVIEPLIDIDRDYYEIFGTHEYEIPGLQVTNCTAVSPISYDNPIMVPEPDAIQLLVLGALLLACILRMSR